MSARKRAKKERAKRRRRSPQDRWVRPVSNAEQVQQLLDWLLPDAGIFAGLGRHGNATWLPVRLVVLALCWAWAESRCVTDAFTAAAAQCQELGLESLGTYQGMMKVLVRWTDRLLLRIWPVLHQRMQQVGGSFWQIGGWVPVAFDGSRSTTPRTQSAEQAFCAPDYGHGQTAKYRKKKTKGLRRQRNERHKPQPQEPQVWITLMWHMGVRLPWMWRLGPSNSSERAHVMEMLEDGEFPEHTLFCGDAGFVGYPLWSSMLARGTQFLVRVGANVRLLSEMGCRLVDNGRVLCWPQAAQQAGQPPLPLRLVRVKIGKTWMWMLTSVLDPHRLTKAQIARFYQLRWGIEVEFRGLKQTLDRAQLRCRNDQRLLVELHWSILAMAVAELFALKEQQPPRIRSERVAQQRAGDPGKRSLASTIRALRFCLTHLTSVPNTGQDLRTRLRQAVTDDYIRKSPKRARYRPPNPDKKPLGNPQVRKLTAKERTQLKSINCQKTAA
jgi:hypothetical protein